MTDSEKRIDTTLYHIIGAGVVLAVRLGEGAPLMEGIRAAVAGGLRVIEVTLTTPGAIEAIGALGRDDSVLVGAGTVLTVDELREAAGAGAKFAMSPVFDPEVLEEAVKLGVLYIPGAATPGEIVAARRRGARLVKVFPAGPLGGPDFLRTVRGPLPDIPLMPTSGPTAETMKDYFDAGAVAVGVGAEVFTEGFTLESVEAAARKVKRAADAARE